MNAFGLDASALSGTFSWTLKVTVDDGTVETKEYTVDIDGKTLDLTS